jgi:hypothetical protein
MTIVATHMDPLKDMDRFTALLGTQRGSGRADFAVSRAAELCAGRLNVEDFFRAWCRHANHFSCELRPAKDWLENSGYRVINVLDDNGEGDDAIMFAASAGDEYLLSLDYPNCRVVLFEMDGKRRGEAEYSTGSEVWYATEYQR